MIIALIWMIVLVIIYVGIYLLNKKTPKPEGCEELNECSGCANIACTHHSSHNEEEKI